MISRSEEKLQQARALGAAHLINTHLTPEWSQHAVELTGGHGFDHILELIGGDNLQHSADALASGGQIAQIGFMGGENIMLSAIPLMLKRAIIQGISVGHRRSLEDLCRAVELYKIKPVISKIYSFSEAKMAFDHLDRGPFGKVVIRVG